jgi:NAD(P)-dependent dehydrogenase (short-subunit alcohol dehydrogenase family)
MVCNMTQQQVSIVTGAGSGIGRQVAIKLAEADCRVSLVGRTEAKLRQTELLIRDNVANPPAICVIAADLADVAAPQQVIAQTQEHFGRIDALANVAGTAPMQPIEAIDAATWRQCIDVNLSAIVLLTSAAWPHFKHQGAGVIVNVSSMASIDPFPGLAIYAAAKVGANMFTSCTAAEGEAIGLKAVCIAPGAVETPMLRQLFSEEEFSKDMTLDPADVATVICDCITAKRTLPAAKPLPCPARNSAAASARTGATCKSHASWRSCRRRNFYSINPHKKSKNS